jgi:hypothetical protein
MVVTRRQNRYRLTEAGKRLYHGLRDFDENHRELTPDEFAKLLQTDAVPMSGAICFSCGKKFNNLVSGFWCLGCTRETYEEIPGK